MWLVVGWLLVGLLVILYSVALVNLPIYYGNYRKSVGRFDGQISAIFQRINNGADLLL
jgi:uncharacterized membrane protein